MTDFLTSLTARSFGTETAIRPRVASLFEPVRAGDSALGEAPAAEPIETAIGREVDPAVDGERRINRPTLALPENDKTRDAMHAAYEDLGSAIIPQPRDNSARRRPSISAADGAEEGDTGVAATVRPRRLSPHQEQTSNETHLSSLLHPDLEPAAPKRVPPKASAASLSRDELFEKDHRGLVLPPKVVTGLTMQMRNAASAMNAGPGAPGREKASNASPALTTASEPSVHVTIGRIEVRAVSESKPARPVRVASPVMSLEEYLHRRTQRGDR